MNERVEARMEPFKDDKGHDSLAKMIIPMEEEETKEELNEKIVIEVPMNKKKVSFQD